MARIYLSPNEDFEHFHNVESSTTLVEGKAIYQCETFQKTLQINETMFTPALKSHILRNIGETVCVFECGHGTGTGP